MATDSTSSPSTSKALFWAGCVVSAIPVVMLTMSAIFKFARPPMVIEGMTKMGWENKDVLLTLGIVELGSVIIYLIPQTAVLGAILLTGYLGGAAATHVRVGESWIGPVVFGVLVWLGLFLRDARIRALIPIRKT